MNEEQARTKARELMREAAQWVVDEDRSTEHDRAMYNALIGAELSGDDHDKVYEAMNDIRHREGVPYRMALVHEDEHGVLVMENVPVDVALATLKRSIEDDMQHWRRINSEQRAKIAELTGAES